MTTMTETAKCYYCEAKGRKNCAHGNKPVNKIKVAIEYRNASGNVHTTTAVFDSFEAMTNQINSSIGADNLVNINFIYN